MFSRFAQKIKTLNRPLDVLSEEYDLPLNRSEDTSFLILLIGLMSFLAILALSGTFALSGMTSRWSSGLENKVTIEIPAETKDGHLLSADTVKKEAQKLAEALEDHPNVLSFHVLSVEEIHELISPWLGKDLALQDIPMPSLISVELKISKTEALEMLKEDIEKISPYALLQTHQDWLDDLIQFARTLKILAMAITLIICATTVTAITAGMRTRMSVHSKEIELLHLIGANDDYIARQFQRHAVVLTLKGSVPGTLAGIVMTIIVIILSGFSGTSLIPRIDIGVPAFLTLCAVPVIACVIASVTSRRTVLHTLAKMP